MLFCRSRMLRVSVWKRGLRLMTWLGLGPGLGVGLGLKLGLGLGLGLWLGLGLGLWLGLGFEGCGW